MGPKWQVLGGQILKWYFAVSRLTLVLDNGKLQIKVLFWVIFELQLLFVVRRPTVYVALLTHSIPHGSVICCNLTQKTPFMLDERESPSDIPRQKSAVLRSPEAHSEA
jgi:hypothetical protein